MRASEKERWPRKKRLVTGGGGASSKAGAGGDRGGMAEVRELVWLKEGCHWLRERECFVLCVVFCEDRVGVVGI